ncbi:MAG TPA: YggS family pyridoxal phosphate-dependent enzyme [Agriterribacter sp.]|nr:YggS family pyridoxal phosphate-dependent enzyme [Agriterribacter sp.]
MGVNTAAYEHIKQELERKQVTLVAVSKTKSVADIQEMYKLGQRDFGENYVQELVEKHQQLPGDICWHFIGHLQRNKVKEIAAFVHLIQGVDSLRLLTEINKQAEKCNRIIAVLLQVHIAREETKFGLDEKELREVVDHLSSLKNIAVKGLMGMASFTNDIEIVRSEFRYLKSIYDSLQYGPLSTFHLSLTTLSMGMSSDYAVAVEEGANMVRIGSLLFGARN